MPPASYPFQRARDALLGRQVPVAWDDATYALKGTGRVALTGEERTPSGPCRSGSRCSAERAGNDT